MSSELFRARAFLEGCSSSHGMDGMGPLRCTVTLVLGARSNHGGASTRLAVEVGPEAFGMIERTFRNGGDVRTCTMVVYAGDVPERTAGT